MHIIAYNSFAKQMLQRLGIELSQCTLYDDTIEPDDTLDASQIQAFADWQSIQDGTALLGLGYRHLGLRQTIADTLHARGVALASYIDDSVSIHASSVLETGCAVLAGTVIDINCKIGQSTMINLACSISHGTTIGAACYLSPHITVCGDVTIGDQTFIGAGSIIRDGVQIGSNVQIAMGSLVTQSVPDNTTVGGQPATKRPALRL